MVDYVRPAEQPWPLKNLPDTSTPVGADFLTGLDEIAADLAAAGGRVPALEEAADDADGRLDALEANPIVTADRGSAQVGQVLAVGHATGGTADEFELVERSRVTVDGVYQPDVNIDTTPVAVGWQETREYTASQSGITTPLGILGAYITTYNGGSGGGSGRRGAAGSARAGGAGGGGGGGLINLWVPASLFGTTYAVTIGAGGAGGPARTTDDTDGAAGTAGGLTTLVTGTSTIRSGTGSGGAGGTASGAAAGAAGATFGGTSGGGGSSSVSGAPNGSSSGIAAPSGGGGGGGITAANVAQTGANSASVLGIYAFAVAAGQPGTAGVASAPGVGGGGGTASASAAGGAGGAGGFPGGGGGGGAASVNGQPSGAGGAGGDGLLRVTFVYQSGS